MVGAALLEVDKVRQAFPKAGGGELLVLEGVNLTLNEGEVVGLIGRSGSGKSTLLRIIAGLALPSNGKVTYLGTAVSGPARGIAMVFQSFALFPWLTVLKNVRIGLEAIGLPEDDTQKRALAAIDLIGLDGFESAYPRELSGGMRQRVGFARALVVHPNILLMDEAFSALDVLTAETLRTDFLDLWSEGKLPIKGVLLVTHNIEEAVLMCNRILIFGSNPGHVVSEIKVDLPQPRNRLDPTFRELVDRIYVSMTERPRGAAAGGRIAVGIGLILSRVSTNLLAGLVERVFEAPYNGKADLPVIAAALQMPSDELLPVAETLQMFRFAEVEGGDIRLTETGKEFARTDMAARKGLFARQLMNYVPLAAHIRQVLDDRESHAAPKSRFLDELQDHMAPELAESTLRAVISWARYAETFSYDDEKGVFNLQNPA